MTDYNPMQEFQKWFYEADQLYDECEINAMLLTTIGIDKFPKSRMVLLKKYSWEGFIFFSNYESEKAKAIANNPKVSLMFNWKKSGRLVQVLGQAVKVSVEESCNYFDVRPRGSKLGAWASRQSNVVKSREVLEGQLLQFEDQFENKEIPKPDYWGGYLVKPETIIFTSKKEGLNKIDTFNLQKDYTWTKTETIEN